MNETQRRDDDFPVWLRVWMWVTLTVLTVGAVIGYQILQVLAAILAHTQSGGPR